jgi:hypothetical protein
VLVVDVLVVAGVALFGGAGFGRSLTKSSHPAGGYGDAKIFLSYSPLKPWSD